MIQLKLLIVDDETLVRQGLTGLLSLEADFQVVGQAAHGLEALQKAQELAPDVVLMDIQMPVMDGVEATRRLSDSMPDVKVLVLTTFEEEELVVQALANGARGYLLKDCGAKQLAAAVRSIALGQTALGAEISQRLLSGAKAGLNGGKSKSKQIKERLSAREQEVLLLLGQGLPNRKIAERLSISEKTVRDHISHILFQLELRDRTQAALWIKDGVDH